MSGLSSAVPIAAWGAERHAKEEDETEKRGTRLRLALSTEFMSLGVGLPFHAEKKVDGCPLSHDGGSGGELTRRRD